METRWGLLVDVLVDAVIELEREPLQAVRLALYRCATHARSRR